MCKQGVSRTVVREVLSRVQASGLMEKCQVPSAKCHGSALSCWSIRSRRRCAWMSEPLWGRDILELCLGLDAQAVALAARR